MLRNEWLRLNWPSGQFLGRVAKCTSTTLLEMPDSADNDRFFTCSLGAVTRYRHCLTHSVAIDMPA